MPKGRDRYRLKSSDANAHLLESINSVLQDVPDKEIDFEKVPDKEVDFEKDPLDNGNVK